MTTKNNSEKNHKRVLLVLGASFIPMSVVVGILIFSYNKNVDSGHSIARLQEEIKKEEVRGAEMRDALAQFYASQGAEDFARERGLIQEAKPRYITVASQKWDTDIILSSHQ
mgnify:CR=1 FL=1